MKYYNHVNYCTQKHLDFQYNKKNSWLHVNFFTRNNEPFTLPCLHPYVVLNGLNHTTSKGCNVWLVG
jgi:hypothetical protein